MPYQEPGLLTDDEYWAIEAYVLDFIRVEPLPVVLGEDNAQDVVLNPEAAPSDGLPPGTPTPAPAPGPVAATEQAMSGGDLAGLVLASVAGVGAVALYLRRRARSR